MRLLIAIPVYNERKYVERVLREVHAAAAPFNAELLLVDDGSTDGTAELLAARAADVGDIHLIRHVTNAGYGQSLIDAFAFADARRFDWVITMDCDEQHEPARIPDFVAAIRTGQWDIVSGSRYLSPSTSDDLPPGDRRSINATITAMVNDLFGLKLSDSFCGFKAHRVAAMRQLRLTEAGYAFPLQLWPAAIRAGLRITEIPVRLIYNDPTRTFGNNLDNAARRLQHYLDVFNAEMAKPAQKVLGAGIAAEAENPADPTDLLDDADLGSPCCCS